MSMARCWSPVRIRCDPAAWNDFHSFAYVPCGKCPACLARKRQEWMVRNTIEFRHATNAYFITLTYGPQFLPVGSNGKPTLVKKDFQDFMKRLRRACEPDKIRFFACGEYGDRGLRPHYHAIIYNWPEDRLDIDKVVAKTWTFNQDSRGIEIRRVTDLRAVNYTAKYTLKSHDYADREQSPFMLCSRRPAIGSQELAGRAKYESESPQMSYTLEDGVHAPVPRYFRNNFKKIMSEDAYARYEAFRRRETKRIEKEVLYKERQQIADDIRKYGRDVHSVKDYDAMLAKFNRKKNNGKL